MQYASLFFIWTLPVLSTQLQPSESIAVNLGSPVRAANVVLKLDGKPVNANPRAVSRSPRNNLQSKNLPSSQQKKPRSIPTGQKLSGLNPQPKTTSSPLSNLKQIIRPKFKSNLFPDQFASKGSLPSFSNNLPKRSSFGWPNSAQNNVSGQQNMPLSKPRSLDTLFIPRKIEFKIPFKGVETSEQPKPSGILDFLKLDSVLPEIDSVSSVTSTETKTEKVTKTLTETTISTVTEQKTVSPIASTEPTTVNDVKKVTEEVSKVVVPKIRGQKYLDKHTNDIESAENARKSYLDFKVIESKNVVDSIDEKLRVLKDLQNKLKEKIKKLKSEKESIKMKISISKNSVDNDEDAVRLLKDEINKNDKLMKLEELEIARLERALSEEKGRYEIMSEQKKLFNERLESVSTKATNAKEEYQSGNVKMNKFSQMIDQIEKDYKMLEEKIEEMLKRRREELGKQTRIEIEKKGLENADHIPLFAVYD